MLWKLSVLVLLLLSAVQNSRTRSVNPMAGLSRIRNGTSTTVEQHPWMVKLASERLFEYNGEHIWSKGTCGGSLITPNCVLTAAHCLQGVTNVKVHAGITYFSESGQSSYADSAILDSQTDIAILVLREPLEGANIETAQLELNRALSIGDVVTVTGWGITEVPEITNDINRSLREVDVPVTNCPTGYDHLFCAGGKDGKDACGNDSGGPVMHNGKQVGIVHAGLECYEDEPDEERIGLYVRLSSIKVAHFIKYNMAEYCQAV